MALLLLGNEGWNVDSLTKRIRRNQEKGRPLFWLQGPADAVVKHLLAGATALIQSSLAEGFGLPIVEAASLGVRLVLSDIPVFHEIAGDDGNYFPVGNAAALASLIERTITGGLPRPKNIKITTWRESAERLAALLL
jgi:glycosyltransferase involved in cell wall biosynthesis